VYEGAICTSPQVEARALLLDLALLDMKVDSCQPFLTNTDQLKVWNSSTDSDPVHSFSGPSCGDNSPNPPGLDGSKGK
jgi:hypothetical protein